MAHHGLGSHTTYGLCVIFIHERRDLQNLAKKKKKNWVRDS